MRPRSTTKPPCDITLTPEMKALCFDYDIKPRGFYWSIHGKVVLTCHGHPNAVIAATPMEAIHQFGRESSL